MAKIVLNPVTNGNTLSVINANFDKIEAEFQDKVVYRDNPLGETNTVRNDLDVDGNDIFNVNTIDIQDLVVQGTPVSGEDLASIPSLNVNVTALQAGLAATNITLNNTINTVNNNAVIEDVNDKKSLRLTTGPIAPLNEAGGRSGKFVAFDAAGAPITSTGTGADIGLRTDLANTTGGNLVAVTPNITGSVPRTETDRARDFVSARTFGVVGDGIVDDTAAVIKAINSGVPVEWHSLTPKITAPISKTLTGDLYWRGDKAQFLNYSAAHVEYMMQFTAIKRQISFTGIGFNGRSLANKLLDIKGDGVTVMTDANSLSITNGVFENCRRINTFSHGDAIRVQGGFSVAEFVGVKVKNVALAPGAGTLGVVGVTGITVYGQPVTAYPLRMLFRNVSIENVYSEDNTYVYDQDGIRAFGPHVATSGQYVPNEMIVDNCDFLNCWGRSIKSQAFMNRTTNSRFKRTQGNAIGVGNDEVTYQVGGGSVRGCTFEYSNGQQPNSCVGIGYLLNYSPSAMRVDNCEVFLDASTTLGSFFNTDTSTGGKVGSVVIKGNTTTGKIQALGLIRINGQGGKVTFNDNTIQELTLGTTSERAAIYVLASGGTSPYSTSITANDNYYVLGHLPAIVRDTVPGNSAQSMVNSFSNTGFSDVHVGVPNVSGLKTNQVARLGKIGPSVNDSPYAATNFNSGFVEVQSILVPDTATGTFNIQNISGALVMIQIVANNTTYAFFSSGTTTNTIISKGAAVEVGGNTMPVTGTYRIWTSASNQISIQNNSGSARSISAFIFSAG